MQGSEVPVCKADCDSLVELAGAKTLIVQAMADDMDYTAVRATKSTVL